ncbi:pyridoxal-phosphate dependent enzyme [Nonomuraea mangrovi]|uniref:Pyridoxal-phosphate dependent enzyme n=1 Tax=Nonomuraea mangrovi TaxID=2316207 RepID=A0ABW4T9J7_9ACTN
MTVSYDDVLAAARRIEGRVLRTPVIEIAEGLFLKLEGLQHSGSFKVRGAFNRMLSAAVPAAGVIAASGGNHGLAVAYAARALGLRAEIFVPVVSSPVKVAGLRALGAEVTQTGAIYSEAAEAAAKRAAETGALEVHAYNHPDVVAGQGTLGLELVDQTGGVDTILIAVGGGGFVAGVTVGAGAGAGAGVGAGVRSDAGVGAGAGMGSDTGAGAGAGMGSEASAGVGSDTGAGVGAGMGSEAGAGAGAGAAVGSEAGAGTGGAREGGRRGVREAERDGGRDGAYEGERDGGPNGGQRGWRDGVREDGRRPTIVAVEPELIPTLHEALKAGGPVPVAVSGVAADALGATRLGDVAYDIVSKAGVRSLLVSDDAIEAARRTLWAEYRIAAEHAGATAYAALLSGGYVPARGERVAVVVCGSNTDPATLL